MTASWLAAATQRKAREPNIPPQDFTLDTIPGTTLPIYPGFRPAHSMLDCTLRGLIIRLTTMQPICISMSSMVGHKWEGHKI